MESVKNPFDDIFGQCFNQKIHTSSESYDSEDDEIATNEELVAKINELSNLVIQKEADNQNLVKKYKREIEECKKYANENIILELISILDTFDIALKAMIDNKVYYSGVNMIMQNLKKILENNGAIEITAKVGSEFDPNCQEIINIINYVDEEYDEKDDVYYIHSIIHSGWKLGNKLIRPMKVEVIK